MGVLSPLPHAHAHVHNCRPYYTPCLRKKTAHTVFVRTSSNFQKFYYFCLADDKRAEVLFYVYIFHLTHLTALPLYLAEHKSTKFYSFSEKAVKNLFCQNFVNFPSI